MAIRKIREMGDDVLTKVCKEVEKVTPRTKAVSYTHLTLPTNSRV